MTALLNKDRIVQDVKAYLRSCHMLAYDSWISDCVEYFLTECDTVTKIKESACQQWLLNNLESICPGSLPNNLTGVEKTILNGNFVLQINSVFDISVPAYQQYLKMKKTDTENIKATMDPEEKISGKRMLKFELTDGKQTISGMEYEPLTNMKTEDILPGSKILLKGPVVCRQRMLLLTNSAVEYLHGEVEDMFKTHSIAAQLARKLNLTLIETNPDEITQTPSITNGFTPDGPSATDSRSHSITERLPPSRETLTHSNPGQSNYGPTPSHINSNASNKRSLQTQAVPEKKIKLDEQNMSLAAVVAVDDDDDDEAMANLEVEDLLVIDELGRSVLTSPEPFVYIKQLNDLDKSEHGGKVFKVKAQIQNVRTKLKMTANREWNLECTIIDGTGCMDVEFSSDILSGFLGYTPEKISELKKIVATKPEIKNDINLAYAKTAEALRSLYCIMELTMYTLPKITNLFTYDNIHTSLLKRRLDNHDVRMKINAYNS